jgi:hypothetical protein
MKGFPYKMSGNSGNKQQDKVLDRPSSHCLLSWTWTKSDVVIPSRRDAYICTNKGLEIPGNTASILMNGFGDT